MIRIFKIIFIFFIAPAIAIAQDNPGDLNYYENWPGTWYEVKDGKVSEKPTFIVEKGLNDYVFKEKWIGKGGDFSKAWRGWDKREQKWNFTWVSRDGYFQHWEGKKIDGIWYMYKTFIIDNKEVLSRQAFVVKSPNELIRTSEHSKDNGKTWMIRFKEKYIKKSE